MRTDADLYLYWQVRRKTQQQNLEVMRPDIQKHAQNQRLEKR
jgi:hypothetical protein